MFFNLNIFSQDLYVYLLALLVSPIIFLIMVIIPKFILSLIFKAKMDIKGNKLLEQTPEISFIEKVINNESKKEILVRNFRNAKYLTNEFDNQVTWENKKFNFDQLESLDLLVDHYAPLQSHAILILNFVDEYKVCKKMCVSYEVKHEASDTAYVYRSIYSNYEGGYIVGSYEDLVGVRYLRYANFTSSTPSFTSNFKNLNIYKLNFTKKECQEIFKNLITDINIYSKQIFFYNFINRNCLSELLKHFRVTGRFNFRYYRLAFLKKVLTSGKVLK